VFVTLKEKGELRGCIGLITAEKPLYLGVRDAATYAALRDPRFPPVNAGELPELEYEISVLTPFRRVLDVKEIHVAGTGCDDSGPQRGNLSSTSADRGGLGPENLP